MSENELASQTNGEKQTCLQEEVQKTLKEATRGKTCRAQSKKESLKELSCGEMSEEPYKCLKVELQYFNCRLNA